MDKDLDLVLAHPAPAPPALQRAPPERVTKEAIDRARQAHRQAFQDPCVAMSEVRRLWAIYEELARQAGCWRGL